MPAQEQVLVDRSADRLRVATPVFEGPLELLLALAERADVDILDVSIAALTDGYLSAIARLDAVDAAEMAEFLWMAARLLLLKSIRLLPAAEPDDDETELLDWEENIRERLEEYKVYRHMAEELMQRAAAEPFAFAPPPRAVEADGQEDALDVDLLLAAFERVLARIPPRPLVVQGHRWTLEEKIELVSNRVRAGALDLVEMLLECEDRFEAVLTFVALLELLRRREVRVRQAETFGPVYLERVG
jgi:segregation and condensation protein A